MSTVLSRFGGQDKLVQWVKDIVDTVKPDRVSNYSSIEPNLCASISSMLPMYSNQKRMDVVLRTVSV